MEDQNTDILRRAREYNVKFIRLQFCDIYGVFKNIAITVEELSKALEGKIRIDRAVIDNSQDNCDKEVCLLPDPESFVIFPWRPREGAVARFICDIAQPDGSPDQCCSRNVLKSVISEAYTMGFHLEVGAAAEFFLFHTNEKNTPTVNPHDCAGFCDLSPSDLGENARRDMVLNLEQMGFQVTSTHHEAAPGQHKILLKYDDALAMADKLVTFRFVVQTIAQRHSLHASFMPKPLNNMKGSALQLSQILYRDQKNVFYNDQQLDSISAEANHYIGGLLQYAPACSPITNPTINSYKRLFAKDYSPCQLGWSRDSRSTILRIPDGCTQDVCIEMRNPDPLCNPYLTIAVMLKSGLEGIRQKILPASILVTNGALQKDVKQLPRTLAESLRVMKADQFVLGVLGEQLAQKYIAAKENECERFESNVHDWELSEYL